MSRYDSLLRFLTQLRGYSVTRSFARIEEIIGIPLPPSARTHAAWWANENPDVTRHVHSRAWMLAGLRAHANLIERSVAFRSGEPDPAT